MTTILTRKPTRWLLLLPGLPACGVIGVAGAMLPLPGFAVAAAGALLCLCVCAIALHSTCLEIGLGDPQGKDLRPLHVCVSFGSRDLYRVTHAGLRDVIVHSERTPLGDLPGEMTYNLEGIPANGFKLDLLPAAITTVFNLGEKDLAAIRGAMKAPHQPG